MYTSFRATRLNFFYESETRERRRNSSVKLGWEGSGVQVHRREWNSAAHRNLKYGFNWSSLAAALAMYESMGTSRRSVEYLSRWNVIPMTDRSVKACAYLKVHNVTLRYTLPTSSGKTANPLLKFGYSVKSCSQLKRRKLKLEERISQHCNDTSDFYFLQIERWIILLFYHSSFWHF